MTTTEEKTLIKTYEFDGTPEGSQLMIQRMYPNGDKNILYGSYCIATEIFHLYETGVYYKKGDHYIIRQPETFEAI